MNNIEQLSKQAIELLKKLISIQSYSGEENETAVLLSNVLEEFGFTPQRKGNNVWASSGEIDPEKPTLMLNSHHDTVKASSKWTKDPFIPIIKDGKLFGLGSNDAGVPLSVYWQHSSISPKKISPTICYFLHRLKRKHRARTAFRSYCQNWKKLTSLLLVNRPQWSWRLPSAG